MFISYINNKTYIAPVLEKERARPTLYQYAIRLLIVSAIVDEHCPLGNYDSSVTTLFGATLFTAYVYSNFYVINLLCNSVEMKMAWSPGVISSRYTKRCTLWRVKRGAAVDTCQL